LKNNEVLIKEQQTKRYKFLTEQTDLFKHFINVKKEGKNPFAAILEQAKAQKHQAEVENSNFESHDHRHAHRKSEKEEDAEFINNDGEEDSLNVITTHFTESPGYVKGGTMRPYQIEGLNWMISLFENGINGILADEMGLGKTLQTLSLLGYLKFYRSIPGPHLLIVPKSTLQNWLNESNRWVPGLNSFIFHGTKEERDKMIKEKLIPCDYDICITSYEMCLLEKAALRKIAFRYIVIDEAHRIKNENSSLSLIVREFHSTNRMLITGTPLQNNLHELWALLNFLLPDIFSSSEDFDSWFSGGDAEEEKGESEVGDEHDKANKTTDDKDQTVDKASANEEQELLMQQLRKLLQPFLLRRLKADVEHSLKPKKEVNLYVGLSDMQRNWYQKILERDLEAVNGLSKGREGKTRLLNIVMQLRKCANHPYLFDGAEPGPPYTTDSHLYENSGKMLVLDKLLQRLKANGSRVLLFSQMSRMLDIFEDYCAWRGYEHCRIDGQTAHIDRIEAIDEFNRPGSDKFIFLLTTRAGGLGINLATADIVIMYDSDWNPQVDLQAQDRAHRIGQLKQVCVFRFITENTIEEKVIERALQKLRLDQLVIQQGRMANANRPLSQDEMLAMIRHGAEKIFSGDNKNSANKGLDEAALEELLKKGEERTKELQGKYSNAGFDDLQRFSISEPNVYQFEGEDYRSAGEGQQTSFMLQQKFLLPARRERRAVLESSLRAAVTGNIGNDRVPLPKLPTLNDFQFWSPELAELFRKETLHYQKLHGYRIPAPPGEIESDEKRIAREAEQKLIDSAEPLTRAEETKKAKLMAEGFSDWSRRDFQAFVRGCEKHGRDALQAIAEEIESKTLEEVKKYSKVFWKRLDELVDGEKIVNSIEKGESRLIRNVTVQKLLDSKISGDFVIPYAIGGPSARGKQFTPEEDEFLLRQLHELGYSTDPSILYPEIHKAILRSPRFKFDFFLKTRTPSDLSKRCQKLISLLEKEAAEGEALTEAAKKKRAANKEPWEKLAEKAAHNAMTQLKNKRTRK
jgi:superfamily II DNA or RNA helicase